MNFSTASHVSFVCNIYLVASTVVCVCFVCYYNLCFVSMYVFPMDLDAAVFCSTPIEDLLGLS